MVPTLASCDHETIPASQTNVRIIKCIKICLASLENKKGGAHGHDGVREQEEKMATKHINSEWRERATESGH